LDEREEKEAKLEKQLADERQLEEELRSDIVKNEQVTKNDRTYIAGAQASIGRLEGEVQNLHFELSAAKAEVAKRDEETLTLTLTLTLTPTLIGGRKER